MQYYKFQNFATTISYVSFIASNIVKEAYVGTHNWRQVIWNHLSSIVSAYIGLLYFVIFCDRNSNK